ncbi:GEVED domain-containing protein, partial [Verrucomicrobiota bacterium]
CFYGWDEYSVYGATQIVADDWPCQDGRPVTDIHWWGSYLGHVQEEPPQTPPSSFHIAVWTDVPGMEPLPGTVVHEWSVPYAEVTETFVGCDFEDPHLRAPEACFRYDYDIPEQEWFRQEGDGNVYWLSIAARYDVGLPGEIWGWTARPAFYRSGARIVSSPTDPIVGSTHARGLQIEGWDMSFELTTDEIVTTTTTSTTTTQITGTTVTTTTTTTTTEPPGVDWGDAPNPYPTVSASNGANHSITGPWLGPTDDRPDAEPDGQRHPEAWGDDVAPSPATGDDEDGVWFPTLIQDVPTNLVIEVSGGGGIVQLWLDLNADGTWQDPDEQVYTHALADGVYTVAILVEDVVQGRTFARVRISRNGGLTPSGSAPNGEVEDHAVWLEDGSVEQCWLQWPSNAEVSVGILSDPVYGRVLHSGVTEGPGRGPYITAELGHGPDGTDPTNPADNPSWQWVAAFYNPAVTNGEDEYRSRFLVNTPGRYDYCFRFSRNGSIWTYGDWYPGNADGYDVRMAGDLLVTGAPEDIVIISIDVTGDDRCLMESVGSAGIGIQVLQMNTNLITGTWGDLETNSAPSPDTNFWDRGVIVHPAESYRILER